MIMNKKYNQNVYNENVRFVILKINEQRNLILYFDFELIKKILLVWKEMHCVAEGLVAIDSFGNILYIV